MAKDELLHIHKPLGKLILSTVPLYVHVRQWRDRIFLWVEGHLLHSRRTKY